MHKDSQVVEMSFCLMLLLLTQDVSHSVAEAAIKCIILGRKPFGQDSADLPDFNYCVGMSALLQYGRH